MPEYRPINTVAWCCIGTLIGSGLFHVPMYLLDDLSWEDPRSFRKPILFGLSTGVTLWSCLWALGRLPRWRYDTLIQNALSVSLLWEVALITLQPWRSAASHFNESTPFDRSVEMTMLALIVIATLLIVLIWVRAWVPRREGVHVAPQSSRTQLDTANELAVHYGLLFLVLSCIVGFVISGIGKWQVAQGRSPELVGEAGVLKFPHGATLHAIQSLAFLAWLGGKWRGRRRLALAMRTAILAHFCG